MFSTRAFWGRTMQKHNSYLVTYWFYPLSQSIPYDFKSTCYFLFSLFHSAPVPSAPLPPVPLPSKGFHWFSRLLIGLPASATAPWPLKSFTISISDCLYIGSKPCSLIRQNRPTIDPLQSDHPMAAAGEPCPSWACRFLISSLALQCPLMFNLFWLSQMRLREGHELKRYHGLPRCNFRFVRAWWEEPTQRQVE